jgi:hypothetical protein
MLRIPIPTILRLAIVVAVAAVACTLGAQPAHAVRDVKVIVVNATDQPLAFRWWPRGLNENDLEVRVVSPGDQATATGGTTGDRWDVVGSIGRTWSKGGASTFSGVCFAGDNPGGSSPRFEMGRYLEQDQWITNVPEPCDLDTPGGWNMSFKPSTLFRSFSVDGVSGSVTLRSSLDYREFTVKITSLPGIPNALLKIDNPAPTRGRVISDPAGVIDCGATACRALIPWGSRDVQLIPVPAPGMVVEQFVLAENIDQPSDLNSPLCSWQRMQSAMPDCVWHGTTNAPTTYRVRFAPAPRQTLATSTSGDGGGRILDDDGALVCAADGTCSASLIEGSTVALHAKPDSDSRFGWWTGACSGRSDTCVVSMTESRSVEAVFLQRTDAIVTVAIAGTGLVRSDSGIYCRTPPSPEQPNVCSLDVPRGTTMTLTPTAITTGATFTGWSGTAGSSCGTSPSCTVTLTGDLGLTATFAAPPVPMTFSVTKSGNGSGRVTGVGLDCGTVCTSIYTPSGQRVATLQANADPGSSFAGWGGICSRSGTLATCQTGGSGEVRATFVQRSPGDFVQVALDVQGTGGGRVVSKPAGVDCTASCTTSFDTTTGSWRADVTLTAIPDAQSVFAGWQGTCWGSWPTGCVLDMTESRRITAVFQPRSTPDPSPSGPVDPDPGVVPEPGPLADDNAAAAPASPTTGDSTPARPVLTGLRVTRRAFRPWQGTVLRYALTQRASVTMEFIYGNERRPRYRFRIPSGAKGAVTGANSVRIVGRVRNQDVRAGRWTIRVVARTATAATPAQVRKVSVRPR